MVFSGWLILLPVLGSFTAPPSCGNATNSSRPANTTDSLSKFCNFGLWIRQYCDTKTKNTPYPHRFDLVFMHLRGKNNHDGPILQPVPLSDPPLPWSMPLMWQNGTYEQTFSGLEHNLTISMYDRQVLNFDYGGRTWTELVIAPGIEHCERTEWVGPWPDCDGQDLSASRVRDSVVQLESCSWKAFRVVGHSLSILKAIGGQTTTNDSRVNSIATFTGSLSLVSSTPFTRIRKTKRPSPAQMLLSFIIALFAVGTLSSRHIAPDEPPVPSPSRSSTENKCLFDVRLYQRCNRDNPSDAHVDTYATFANFRDPNGKPIPNLYGDSYKPSMNSTGRPNFDVHSIEKGRIMNAAGFELVWRFAEWVDLESGYQDKLYVFYKGMPIAEETHCEPNQWSDREKSDRGMFGKRCTKDKDMAMQYRVRETVCGFDCN
ncbi:hypothetical protein CC80DRAFT_501201 [Byssothecium circinans]|uniref:Uncharacterized protein n=1 Tax=Byssothecium circinans TaxID=147558 RepID=A0A6A5UDG9_9PLEO|nr:hypothetical protein CC80DRAFT_501201 [Byssothecium circinans]